ncbi:MAG: GntR family transcriptional regulator [Alkalilacustris sp.]
MSRAVRPPSDPVLPLLAAIDRGLGIPVSVQLRGALEFGIALGRLAPGLRLPSVREMARQLAVSPVTVAAVYRDLREAGLIESRVGAGSYVADAGVAAQGGLAERHRRLQGQIDALIRLGAELGLGPADIAARVACSGPPQAEMPGLRILVVSHFPRATDAYAEALRAHVGMRDRVTAATFDALRAGRPVAADLAVTPRNLMAEAGALCPGVPLVGMTFIPDEATRVALAGLAPEARVVAVSYFAHFLPVMRAGLQRFAPHLAGITAILRDDPGLEAALAGADVLVCASGTDDLAARLRPGQRAIDYLHTPDPRAIREAFLPALAARRTQLQTGDPHAHRRGELVRDRGLPEAG